MIDIVILSFLLAFVGLTLGERETTSTGVSITLGTLPMLVFGILALLYYFALEARGGQTVGKRLLGLRVTRADGGRPSTGAIAARTLLRIVDSLPLMYVVGFITIVASGSSQRIGDMAAGTVVTRARPARPRG